MNVQTLTRIFRYNGMTLADPSPTMSPQQVIEHYASAFPELNTATIEGPTEENGTLVYVLTKAVGTKG